MRVVGASEVRKRLSRLLEEVAKGESITITKRGIPVATLVPARTGKQSTAAVNRAEVAKAIKEWIEYRNSHNITLGPGLTIRDLIDEGRQ